MAEQSKTATKKAGVDYVRALSAFRYGKLRLSRGQVFKLAGARNDASLLDLRYVVPVSQGTELVECGICGALFINHNSLESHGDTWHSYECDCGWSPQPSSSEDRDSQMRRHQVHCPVAKSERERAHKEHVAAAVDKAKR